MNRPASCRNQRKLLDWSLADRRWFATSGAGPTSRIGILFWKRWGPAGAVVFLRDDAGYDVRVGSVYGVFQRAQKDLEQVLSVPFGWPSTVRASELRSSSKWPENADVVDHVLIRLDGWGQVFESPNCVSYDVCSSWIGRNVPFDVTFCGVAGAPPPRFSGHPDSRTQ